MIGSPNSSIMRAEGQSFHSYLGLMLFLLCTELTQAVRRAILLCVAWNIDSVCFSSWQKGQADIGCCALPTFRFDVYPPSLTNLTTSKRILMYKHPPSVRVHVFFEGVEEQIDLGTISQPVRFDDLEERLANQGKLFSYRFRCSL